MGRQTSIHKHLPREVRKELDTWLLERTYTQVECAARLQGMGYNISKSAIGRYSQKLFNGAEDLKSLTVAGQPLGQAIAEVFKGSDEVLALLIEELVTYQVRQLAILRKIQSRMKERQRQADALEWAKAQQGMEAQDE